MSAHDELLKIHTILRAHGDCQEISAGDTLTVRMLKTVIHDWHKQQRIVAAMSADRFGPPGRGARGLGPPPTTQQVAAMQQSQQGEIVAGKHETPNAKLTGVPPTDATKRKD